MHNTYLWVNLAILLLMGLVLAIGFRSLPDSPGKKKLTTLLLVLTVLLLVSTLSQNMWPNAFGEVGRGHIASIGP